MSKIKITKKKEEEKRKKERNIYFLHVLHENLLILIA